MEAVAAIASLHRQMQPALNIQSANFGIDIECLMTSNPELMTCTALPPSGQRVCACLATPPNDGTVGGDPHVHSLRGAHYTLLQEGVFVAWNFSKAVPASGAAARGWQLLAASQELPPTSCRTVRRSLVPLFFASLVPLFFVSLVPFFLVSAFFL